MAETNRQVLLKRRPNGMPVPEDFSTVDSALPEPGEGQVLLRGIYLSLDPYMRGRISGQQSYAKRTEIGEVIEGRVIGQVAKSRHSGFREGDIAAGGFGWQTWSAVDGGGLQKLDPAAAPISTALGILGMPGLTAYAGLKTIGEPKPGETVVISAASGAVGAVAGQLAKRDGCRVVGIAGGAEKCAWLTRELGFDAAVDYKGGDLSKALKAAAANGIDVYFDNTGGDILETCLFQMNAKGRIACCGAVSQYDGAPAPHGPRGIPGLLVVKRLVMQGFIVMDYYGEREAALADLQSWVAAGKLKVREDIIDGLENTPRALIGLLAGDNRGKRMVKVA